MLKFLLVDDETVLVEVMQFMLESEFQCKVYPAFSGNEAIALIKKEGPFDCVISDYNMKNGSGGDLFLYLQKHQPETPFILCTSEKLSRLKEFQSVKIAGHIIKPMIHGPLEELLHKISIEKNWATLPIASPTSEYCPIQGSLLQKLGTNATNLFIRIKDGPYIRVMAADSKTNEDVSHFQKMGFEVFYIKRDQLNEFLKNASEYITSLLNEKALSPHDSIELFKEIHSTIRKISTVFGFTEEVQELTTKAVQLAVNTLNSCKEENFFKSFKNSPLLTEGSYASGHSFFVAHIACGLASLIQLKNNSTFFKLSLCAFLHDISLENELFVHLRSESELEKAGMFSVQNWKSILEHPEKAAQLMAQIKQAPIDAEQIVRQHHEKPDGTGFPKKLREQQINILSAVFIIAEDLASSFFQKGTDWNLEVFLNERRELYSVGKFHTLYQAMEKCLPAS